MKASELRIGNWLNDYQFNELIKVCIGVLEEIEGNIGGLEPITLTEEWLIRFGFKEVEENTFDKEILFNRYISLVFWPKNNLYEVFIGSEVTWVICSRIKYVHQLQNLYFALTGTELEIK